MTEAEKKRQRREKIEKWIAYGTGTSIGAGLGQIGPALSERKKQHAIFEMARKHQARGRPKNYRVMKGYHQLSRRITEKMRKAHSIGSQGGAALGFGAGYLGLKLYKKHQAKKRKHSSVQKLANLPAMQAPTPATLGGRAAQKLYGHMPGKTMADAAAATTGRVSAKNITMAALRKAQQTGAALTGKTVLGAAVFDELTKIALEAMSLTSHQVGTLAKRRTMPGSSMPLNKLGTGLGMPGAAATMPGLKTPGLPRLGNSIKPSGAAGMGPKPPTPPTGMTGIRQ